jgi:hypothetical protein
MIRWDLHVVDDDEGAGEPVDPDLPSSSRTALIDEVLPGNAHVYGLSIHGALWGIRRTRQLQTETGGAHEFTQVRPPEGLRPTSCLSDLVLLVYVELLQWCADAIWWRWKKMAWLAYACLSVYARLYCSLCQLACLGGRPW